MKISNNVVKDVLLEAVSLWLNDNVELDEDGEEEKPTLATHQIFYSKIRRCSFEHSPRFTFWYGELWLEWENTDLDRYIKLRLDEKSGYIYFQCLKKDANNLPTQKNLNTNKNIERNSVYSAEYDLSAQNIDKWVKWCYDSIL